MNYPAATSGVIILTELIIAATSGVIILTELIIAATSGVINPQCEIK